MVDTRARARACAPGIGAGAPCSPRPRRPPFWVSVRTACTLNDARHALRANSVSPGARSTPLIPNLSLCFLLQSVAAVPRRALAAAAAAAVLAAVTPPATAAPSLGKNRAVELAQRAAERKAAMKAKVDAAKTTQKASF